MAMHVDRQAADSQQPPRPPSNVADSPPPGPVSSVSTYRPANFDREILATEWIEENREQLTNVDSLEGALIREVKPGRRSPERRANKLSFFEEITAEQMHTYSPAQIATVLQQRENLLSVLSQQHQASGGAHEYHPSGSHDGRRLNPPPGPSNSANTKPWVPRAEECQVKYCHRCRPSFGGRSFLSLDGIINGDIPPTAATSFGLQNKPIADAKVVKNIGLRAVPFPWRRGQPHADRSSNSTLSTLSILDLSDIVGDVLDYQPVQAGEVEEVEEGSTRAGTPPTPSDSEATSFGEGPLEVGEVLAYEKIEVELEEDSVCDGVLTLPSTPSDFGAR
ncbi:hypothetical protein F4679DRAFT_594938 [Xylaria curta]|nr:hypothetical protein F4679DRAFT_594938 [Xylaria curta]